MDDVVPGPWAGHPETGPHIVAGAWYAAEQAARAAAGDEPPAAAEGYAAGFLARLARERDG